MAGQSKVVDPSNEKDNFTKASRKSKSSLPSGEAMDNVLQSIENLNQPSKRKRTDATVAAPRKKQASTVAAPVKKQSSTAAAPKRVKQTVRVSAEGLDVTGTYKITSSAMEAKWNAAKPTAKTPKRKLDLEMTVYHIKVKTKYQFFATFNFHGAEGLMRFESTTPKSSAITINNDDIPEHIDSGYNSNGRHRDADYKRKVFLFDNADHVPTTDRAIWRYRWRGRGDEDELENVILSESDKYLQLIKFQPAGKLTGTFRFQGTTMAFSGNKTSTTNTQDFNPDEMWAAHGEIAYKQERGESDGADYSANEMGDPNYEKRYRRELKAKKVEEEEEEGWRAACREERIEEKMGRRREYRVEMRKKGVAAKDIDSDNCLSDGERGEDEQDNYDDKCIVM